MKKPISVQLYSLREAAKTNFARVIRDVAKIGYKGVEPAGLHGMSAAQFRDLVESEGMKISSSHGPAAKPATVQEAVDHAGALGLDIVNSGYGPDDFKDLEAVKRTAGEVNAMLAKVAAAGFTLFLHNHYWEFEKLSDGRIAYHVFAELCPDAMYEIDTYWAANFGANDPAAEVRRFADKTILLHLKDGPLAKDKAMTAIGSGKMDTSAVISAANEKVLRWLIVELDRCDTDMLEAVRQSYRYLISKGLAEGNVKV